MENKVSCSERIREAIRIRDMTQAQLCKMTGIPKSAMSQYCNGGLQPRQNRIFLMSEALRVNPAWLMGLDVQMEEKKPATADSDGLDDELISRLLELSPEEIAKVDAFVQGLLASR